MYHLKPRSRTPSAVKSATGPEYSEEYIQQYLNNNEETRTPQESSSSNPLTACFRKKRSPSPNAQTESEPAEPKKPLPVKTETRANPPKKPSIPGARSKSPKPKREVKRKEKKTTSARFDDVKTMKAGNPRIPLYEEEAEKRRFPFSLFGFGSSKKEEPKKEKRPRKKKDPSPLPEDVLRKGSKRVKYQMPTGETVDVRRSSRNIAEKSGTTLAAQDAIEIYV